MLFLEVLKCVGCGSNSDFSQNSSDFRSIFHIFLDFNVAVNINSTQVLPVNSGGSFTKFAHMFFEFGDFGQ